MTEPLEVELKDGKKVKVFRSKYDTIEKMYPRYESCQVRWDRDFILNASEDDYREMVKYACTNNWHPMIDGDVTMFLLGRIHRLEKTIDYMARQGLQKGVVQE